MGPRSSSTVDPAGSSPGCGVESQLRPAVGELLRAQSGVCVLCSPQLAALVCFSLKEAPGSRVLREASLRCVPLANSGPSAEERKHPLITASVKRSGAGVGKTNLLSSRAGD